MQNLTNIHSYNTVNSNVSNIIKNDNNNILNTPPIVALQPKQHLTEAQLKRLDTIQNIQLRLDGLKFQIQEYNEIKSRQEVNLSNFLNGFGHNVQFSLEQSKNTKNTKNSPPFELKDLKFQPEDLSKIHIRAILDKDMQTPSLYQMPHSLDYDKSSTRVFSEEPRYDKIKQLNTDFESLNMYENTFLQDSKNNILMDIDSPDLRPADREKFLKLTESLFAEADVITENQQSNIAHQSYINIFDKLVPVRTLHALESENLITDEFIKPLIKDVQDAIQDPGQDPPEVAIQKALKGNEKLFHELIDEIKGVKDILKADIHTLGASKDSAEYSNIAQTIYDKLMPELMAKAGNIIERDLRSSALVKLNQQNINALPDQYANLNVPLQKFFEKNTPDKNPQEFMTKLFAKILPIIDPKYNNIQVKDLEFKHTAQAPTESWMKLSKYIYSKSDMTPIALMSFSKKLHDTKLKEINTDQDPLEKSFGFIPCGVKSTLQQQIGLEQELASDDAQKFNILNDFQIHNNNKDNGLPSVIKLEPTLISRIFHMYYKYSPSVSQDLDLEQLLEIKKENIEKFANPQIDIVKNKLPQSSLNTTSKSQDQQKNIQDPMQNILV